MISRNCGPTTSTHLALTAESTNPRLRRAYTIAFHSLAVSVSGASIQRSSAQVGCLVISAIGKT